MADPGFSWGWGGAPTPEVGLFFKLFAENCMKMKEFGPPLDPPMVYKVRLETSTTIHVFPVVVLNLDQVDELD